MSLIYFIDGINLIRSCDHFDAGDLKDKQEQLIRWIGDARPAGSPANRVIVVFDGNPPPGFSRLGPATVVHSGDLEADDVIKQRVDALSNPRVAVVVTNDRALQRWVRGAGARTMSCADFMRRPALQPVPAGVETPAVNQDPGLEEELLRLWGRN